MQRRRGSNRSCGGLAPNESGFSVTQQTLMKRDSSITRACCAKRRDTVVSLPVFPLLLLREFSLSSTDKMTRMARACNPNDAQLYSHTASVPGALRTQHTNHANKTFDHAAFLHQSLITNHHCGQTPLTVQHDKYSSYPKAKQQYAKPTFVNASYKVEAPTATKTADAKSILYRSQLQTLKRSPQHLFFLSATTFPTGLLGHIMVLVQARTCTVSSEVVSPFLITSSSQTIHVSRRPQRRTCRCLLLLLFRTTPGRPCLTTVPHPLIICIRLLPFDVTGFLSVRWLCASVADLRRVKTCFLAFLSDSVTGILALKSQCEEHGRDDGKDYKRDGGC